MTVLVNDRTAASRSLKWWAGRLVTGLAILVAVGALGFYVLAISAKHGLSVQHPPPGRLVDIGGYRMHLNCTGNGHQTVVFEAGNADFSVHWSKVQPEVARIARACSYDRAGLGWSEPSPRERSASVMVEELHALLTISGVKRPYVLVGHSLGAINARLFAQSYPQEVSGLVLVDPAHEAQMDRLPVLRDAAVEGAKQFEGLAPLSSFGLLAMMPGNIPNRGLPDAAQRQYAAILATTDYFRVAAAETTALAGNLATAGRTAIGIGDKPLTIISRGRPDPVPGLSAAEAAGFEREWAAMQSELVSLSTQGRQVLAEESGHYVQLQQPEIVVDAIAQLITAADR